MPSVIYEKESSHTDSGVAACVIRVRILLHDDFFNLVALAADYELACGGFVYAHALEVEVFNGGVFVVDDYIVDAGVVVKAELKIDLAIFEFAEYTGIGCVGIPVAFPAYGAACK